MIEVICLGPNGIRGAHGVYCAPFKPIPLTDAQFERLSMRGKHIVQFDMFLDAVQAPRGGYSFQTLRNFARRMGLDLPISAQEVNSENQAEERQILSTLILNHFKRLDRASSIQHDTGRHDTAARTLNVRGLARAVEQDDYYTVLSLLGALNETPKKRDKKSLYAHAHALLEAFNDGRF